MKIGIVTVHDAGNLGSFLQALGLQELVRSNGDIPYIIETRSKFIVFCRFMGYDNATQKGSIKAFVKFLIDNIIHPSKTLQKFRKYIAYRNDWKILGRRISVNKCNKAKLDVLLLGSDEIWNINFPVFRNPYMYGIGINSAKKIAYAISCGWANINTFKKFPHLLDGINKLDSILVRDYYTETMLNQYDIDFDGHICDPTLQVDIRKYMKLKNNVKIFQEDYIVIYSYSVDENIKNFIMRFAKENGLKTVAVSLPQDWCDQYCNCSPLEFGAVLESAKYVFTSTFHGTIFSALYHKAFVSLAEIPKVEDVLKLLNLESRRFLKTDNYEDFVNKIQSQYDFDELENRITQLRDQSARLYKEYVGERNNADL